MSTVAEIPAALPALTLVEREEIARDGHDLDDDERGRQRAQAAAPGGKLYRLMEQAESEANDREWRDVSGREPK